jgi:hypothetical protein
MSDYGHGGGRQGSYQQQGGYTNDPGSYAGDQSGYRQQGGYPAASRRPPLGDSAPGGPCATGANAQPASSSPRRS